MGDSVRRGWIALLLLIGCTAEPTAPSSGGVRLDDVPFFVQEDFQCGPAALASFLAHRGIEVAPATLTDRFRSRGTAGAVTLQLVWAADAYGADVIVGEGSIEGLERSLRAGDPVLVQLGLPGGGRHFAIVTGIDPAAGRIRMHGRDRPHKETSVHTFLRRWNRSGRWRMAWGMSDGAVDRDDSISGTVPLGDPRERSSG